MMLLFILLELCQVRAERLRKLKEARAALQAQTSAATAAEL